MVDRQGRLIAHPDLSLVLRDTDLSHLPQVAAALADRGASEAEVARSLDGASVLTAHAVAPRTQWTVFVEQPLAEALASAYRSLLLSLALLGFGLMLAAVSGVALARRMAAPIRLLQAGAERLGAGDLAQRLDIRTGDEIEALAAGFNHMAERLQKSYENLEGKVEVRTRDLNQALARQTATADVLKIISRSIDDAAPVFETILEACQRLFDPYGAAIYLVEGDIAKGVARRGFEGHGDWGADTTPLAGGSTGQAITERRAVHFRDLAEKPDLPEPARTILRETGSMTALYAPMLSGERGVGSLVVTRRPKKPSSKAEIDFIQTFADQAVIAIENARLFTEVQARTRELEPSLADLRQAQDRLVQSEKLASLGQLTAGIAHEIKNPLNFVNNFSSLSRELLEELRETLQKLPANVSADAEELIGLIDSNLEKVVNHGRRADSIVKNMLLHSRDGSGERSRVNVNAMVEEALNLGYHGARADKPGFSVTIEKSLDAKAGEAELYLQEVTRVLLNLISNGLYATDKRRQAEGPGYAPTLKATTRDLGHSVEIRIRDNGTGIPDEVRAKMFNPFFTIKPAGEGAGLGLSLSHDIVVKQHGGTLDVETAPGAFTEFVITLQREGAGG